MEKFFNFIKDYYSYIIYIFQAIISFIVAFVAFRKSRLSSVLMSENDSLLEGSSLLAKRLNFYTMLPSLINTANILYPIHGQGNKRFDYVYQRALQILGCEDSPDLHSEVSHAVNFVLLCDKFEKISRDTLEQEPKKDLYETKKNVEVERPESLRKNCEENKSLECGARYVSRRN